MSPTRTTTSQSTGALVTLIIPDGGTRTVTANKLGLWKAQMVLGEHTVAISAPNCVGATDTASFSMPEQAETRDVGVAEVSGERLDWHLGPEQTTWTDLVVTNTGPAPLTVSIAERARSEQLVDATQANDLPWLALTGEATEAATELAVGQSTIVTATVDTAGTDPGLLVGDVLVSSNGGRNPAQLAPATLAASAYWVTVNAGGRAFTDADAFAWSGDRARSDGSWGYVGGAAEATTSDIAGTDDDELFRTQRTARKFSYVFEDAPPGTYVIGLGFAEIANVKAGERMFDVVVSGKALLYEHDVRAEAGRLTADSHTATVVHLGGDLKVEAIGERSRHEAILSTLKVLEDPHPATS